MTDAPKPEREIFNEPTLWVTDAEIIRRLGAPEKVAYQAIQSLDRNRASGFPKKNDLWGKRRYWPAVKRYFDLTNGMFPQVERRRAG